MANPWAGCWIGLEAAALATCNRNAELCAEVLAADCGTSRYSAESVVDEFAANSAHAEPAVGSSEV